MSSPRKRWKWPQGKHRIRLALQVLGVLVTGLGAWLCMQWLGNAMGEAATSLWQGFWAVCLFFLGGQPSDAFTPRHWHMDKLYAGESLIFIGPIIIFALPPLLTRLGVLPALPPKPPTAFDLALQTGSLPPTFRQPRKTELERDFTDWY